MGKSLSQIKDLDREILLRLESDKELLEFCSLSKYNLSLCDESFYRNRLFRKYPETVKDKPQDMKWKQYYLKMVFYIGKLSEEYNFNFNTGNPEKYYRILKNPLIYDQMYETSKNNYIDLLNRFLTDPSQIYIWINILSFGIAGAAEGGHKSLVTYFLACTDLAPQHRPDFLEQAIGGASFENKREIIEYLLKEGADPNDGLYGAAKSNNKEMVKYLISKGADNWNNGLYGSAEGKNNELAKYFISLGANNWEEALGFAERTNNEEMIQYFTERI